MQRRHRLREIALYLNLGAAFSAATFLLLPSIDDGRRPPPYFSISVPYTESGAARHINSLLFEEDHGARWKSELAGVGPDWLRGHSLTEPKGISLELSGDLSAPSPHNDQWVITIDLPAQNPVVTACNTNYFGDDFYDTLRGATCSITNLGGASSLQITGTLPAGCSTFRVGVQLANIEGVGYLTTRTRVEATFPTLKYPPTDKPLPMLVYYWIPDAQKVTWSGTAPTYFYGNQQTRWSYQLGGDSSQMYQPPSSGRRDATVASDDARRFFAGAFIGLAGAAWIAALQAALVRREP